MATEAIVYELFPPLQYLPPISFRREAHPRQSPFAVNPYHVHRSQLFEIKAIVENDLTKVKKCSHWSER